MRISADNESPLYYRRVLADSGVSSEAIDALVVSVNGTATEAVIEADDVAGWARVMAYDEHGEPLTTLRMTKHGSAFRPVIVRVEGTVVFWWPGRA